MPVMHLIDLPTEDELDGAPMSPESFLEVFHENKIGPLQANVEENTENPGHYLLGGYSFGAQARWFKITKG